LDAQTNNDIASSAIEADQKPVVSNPEVADPSVSVRLSVGSVAAAAVAAAAFATTTTAATAVTTAAAAGATTVATAAAFTTAAAAAATIAATTAAATKTASAGWARFQWACFVDDQVTAAESCAVHAADGRLGLSVIAHFHETEAFRAAGFTFHHDLGACNGTKFTKGLFEITVANGEGQIAHIQSIAQLGLLKITKTSDGVPNACASLLKRRN
jgi:hypothetical protein